jgi:hypothetical protein
MKLHWDNLILCAITIIASFSIEIVAISSRTEVLDDDGLFRLTWEVEENAHLITFSLDVITNGWIGFGISNSKNGGEADFIVGGVFSNGTSYFTVRTCIFETRKTISNLDFLCMQGSTWYE